MLELNSEKNLSIFVYLNRYDYCITMTIGCNQAIDYKIIDKFLIGKFQISTPEKIDLEIFK